MNIRKNTTAVVRGGMIAALYVLLTVITNAFGLANGVIQIRLSEALTVLPVFFPSAVGGLFVGCVVANIMTGCVVWDVIFGSLATLFAAIFTRMLRKNVFVAQIFPVAFNVAVVPLVLKYAYGLGDAWWFMACTVAAGELISCYILGIVLYYSLRKHKKQIL